MIYTTDIIYACIFTVMLYSYHFNVYMYSLHYYSEKNLFEKTELGGTAIGISVRGNLQLNVDVITAKRSIQRHHSLYVNGFQGF